MRKPGPRIVRNISRIKLKVLQAKMAEQAFETVRHKFKSATVKGVREIIQDLAQRGGKITVKRIVESFKIRRMAGAANKMGIRGGYGVTKIPKADKK